MTIDKSLYDIASTDLRELWDADIEPVRVLISIYALLLVQISIYFILTFNTYHFSHSSPKPPVLHSNIIAV